MTTLTLDELCARIAALDRPTLVSHARPDGDTVGSACALAHLLTAMGKRVAWDCANPCPKRLAFLMKDIPFVPPEENAGGDVVTLDVASPSQLGALEETYVGRVSFSIDHHGTCTPFAPLYLRADAAAVGEIVAEIGEKLLENGTLSSLPLGFAYCAYAALSSDTGCFRYANATPRSHLIASRLLAMGVDGAEVNHLLFDSHSPEELEAEKIALSHLRVLHDGKIGAVVLPFADRLGIDDEYFESAINVARSVEGAEIGISARELQNGTSRVSLRSTCADVSAVAALFGGGGHLRAAGFSYEGNAEEALAAVLPHLVAALS